MFFEGAPTYTSGKRPRTSTSLPDSELFDDIPTELPSDDWMTYKVISVVAASIITLGALVLIFKHRRLHRCSHRETRPDPWHANPVL